MNEFLHLSTHYFEAPTIEDLQDQVARTIFQVAPGGQMKFGAYSLECDLDSIYEMKEKYVQLLSIYAKDK